MTRVNLLLTRINLRLALQTVFNFFCNKFVIYAIIVAMNQRGQNRNRHTGSGTQLRGRRRKKKKNPILPIIGMICFVILILGLLAGYFLYRRYSYGKDRADLQAYFSETGPDAYPVFMDNANTGIYARNFNGVYYLSLDDVHTYISTRFYYGAADGAFIFTTPDSILTNTVGTGTVVSSTAGDISEPYVVSCLEGETLYVAIDYVAKYYNVTYTAYQEPNRLALYVGTRTDTVAQVTDDTQVRMFGGVKSDILKEVTEGERVVVLEVLDEDWTKVRTEDCFIGYIENKRLGATEQYTYGTDQIPLPAYSTLKRDKKICLGWHFMVNEVGNESLDEVTEGTKGLNVIAPTWYLLKDDIGGMESFGSVDYVAKAHAKGLEVWATVRNFRDDDILIDDKALLSKATSRQTLINNLITESKRLGVDGINLDFEQITADTGKDYVEFVRELSIACRAEGFVYSIDNYVPYHFNDYYDRTEQGIVADYVVIMGYDEHTAGSEEAGSVASIEYVRYGIESTIAQVDPSKVINALPFYTRIWTTDAQGKITSRAVGMDAAKEAAAGMGMEFAWNDETDQYYGAVDNADGSRTEIWLEDKESLNAKLTVMKANNLGGVAGWRLGLEAPVAWDEIALFLQ